MNAAPPTSGSAALAAQRKRMLRILGMTASALMVLGVLVVFALIVRTERAHDEERCKFAPLSRRTLGEVEVVEERRSCLPELEERRYLVRRGVQAAYELARKRLPSAHFTAERYAWKLREDKPGMLVIEIDVDGKLSSEFHEEDVKR
jgi:hypothetical protein